MKICNQRSQFYSIILLIHFLIFGGFSSISAFAQSEGWKALMANNFPKAKEIFDEALQRDSSDRENLLGALFIYDMYKHTKSFDALSEKLLKHHPEEIIWRTFSLNSTKKENEWLENLPADAKKNPPLAYATFRMEQEYSKGKKKKLSYEEKLATLDIHSQFSGWSFIGPFLNLGGMGIHNVYPPERDGFRPKEVYRNAYGLDLKWFTSPYPHPNFTQEFEDYLLRTQKLNVFYARKAFSLNKAQSVTWYLTRNSPIQIWVDGKLILKDEGAVAHFYDGESIEMQMEAGEHEILIKTCKLNSWMSANNLFGLTDANAKNHRSYSLFNFRALCADGSPLIFDTIADPIGKPAGFSSFQVTQDRLLDAQLTKLEHAEKSWSDFYLLARLANVQGKTRKVEPYFVKWQEKYPESMYFRFLMANIYERNGNKNLAFRAVSQVDLVQTPQYKLLMKNLKEINREFNPEEYEKELENFKKIAPSNKDFIYEYLNHYRPKKDSIRIYSFRNETLDKYPEYYYIFDDEDGAEYVNKKVKKEKKKRKEEVSWKKDKKSLEDQIKEFPYLSRRYREMVEGLLKEKEYSKALEVAQSGLAISPYSTNLLTQVGDAWEGLNHMDSAMVYYEKALQLLLISRGYYGEDVVDIQRKMDQFKEKTNIRNSFKTKTLENILAEREIWEEKYKDHDAVILMYTTDFFLNENGTTEGKNIFALLINTENGINPWTEENFSYLGSKVTVRVIKADSSIVQPEMQGTQAVFKDLAPGDIIYAEGTRVDRNLYSTGHTYGAGDYFMIRGGTMFINPIYYQKMEIAIPEGTEVQYKRHNIPEEVEKNNHEGYDFYRWAWYDTPHLIQEEGAFRKWAASPDIQFTSAKDWGYMADWYDQLTRRKLEPNYYIKELHAKIVKPGMSQDQIVQACYNYITQEINYSSVSFLQSSFVPQSPELTCSAGIGDCKDVAALMIALLRLSEIESYYVLVQTYNSHPEGYLPQNIFNHAIVAYMREGEMHYLDLTTDRYPNYVLPEPDHDAWALLIKPGEKSIFKLPNDKIESLKNGVQYELSGKFSPTNDLNMELKGTYLGIEGGKIREYLTSQKGKNIEAYLQTKLGLGAFPGNQIENFRFNALDSIDVPLKLKCQIQVDRFVEELYGMNIFPIPFAEQLSISNALMTSVRRTALDLSNITNIAPIKQNLTLAIPKGYQLFSVPEDIHLDNKYGSYDLTFQLVGSELRITKSHRFKVAHIEPIDYLDFREFFFEMARLEKTKLILVKEGFSYP